MTAPIAALYQNINVNQMTTNTSSVFQKKKQDAQLLDRIMHKLFMTIL